MSHTVLHSNGRIRPSVSGQPGGVPGSLGVPRAHTGLQSPSSHGSPWSPPDGGTEKTLVSVKADSLRLTLSQPHVPL